MTNDDITRFSICLMTGHFLVHGAVHNGHIMSFFSGSCARKRATAADQSLVESRERVACVKEMNSLVLEMMVSRAIGEKIEHVNDGVILFFFFSLT